MALTLIIILVILTTISFGMNAYNEKRFRVFEFYDEQGNLIHIIATKNKMTVEQSVRQYQKETEQKIYLN